MRHVSVILVFPLITSYVFVHGLSLSPTKIVKQLHEGADDAISGTIKGVTEVVGTPVKIEEVKFYLHTSKGSENVNNTIDPLEPKEISETEGKIYFIIHGWKSSRQASTWYKSLTHFLLKREPEASVLQIDWSKPAANNYAFAAFSTESVGKIIGNLIHKLVQEYHVPLKNIVLIGHSLGGQISGWSGKRFHDLTNSKLPRIIALDPAGPLFNVRPDEKRLNKNDAEVVMVIHTDGGKLGMKSNTGTIDFFPNGGSDQPGCYRIDLSDITSLADPITCDHGRSHEILVEAMKRPNFFMAKRCGSYKDFKKEKCEDAEVSLGDLETTESGSFYLDTGDTPPFIKRE